MFYEFQNYTPVVCVLFLGTAFYLGVIRSSLLGVLVSLSLLLAAVSAIDPRWPTLWHIPAIMAGLLAVVAILFVIDQVLFELALNKWRKRRWAKLHKT